MPIWYDKGQNFEKNTIWYPKAQIDSLQNKKSY